MHLVSSGGNSLVPTKPLCPRLACGNTRTCRCGIRAKRWSHFSPFYIQVDTSINVHFVILDENKKHKNSRFESRTFTGEVAFLIENTEISK